MLVRNKLEILDAPEVAAWALLACGIEGIESMRCCVLAHAAATCNKK